MHEATSVRQPFCQFERFLDSREVAVVREYSIQARKSMDRFHPSGFISLLDIIVRKEAAVAVALKPMVEMALIQVGRNKFFPEFVGLAA
jgi:hypothetical protein